jgi:molecular chaperone HtpG
MEKDTLENGFRTGASLLETLTSALYADPIVVFREYVQNAVDGFSKDKSKPENFRVDISLVSASKIIVIRDNGGGIPPDKFDETMRGLGRSTKASSQIGFRGIGRLAGLSFCKKLYFINNVSGQKQTFSFDGDKYRKILLDDKKKYDELDNVVGEIVSSDNQTTPDASCLDKGDYSFAVILSDVSDELVDCIYRKKPARGKSGKRSEINTIMNSGPTDDFVNELSLMLPVPYDTDFSDASAIRNKFKEWFNVELSSREFKVFLEGKQLFKPFRGSAGMDFRIIPVKIIDLQNDVSPQSSMPNTIGLLWIRFDYVFKAMKQNWGIAVRSKNMLVRSGSVLAEQAVEDRDAITTYGQYLSALKGVTGELLLETGCLSDNSRRDWFKLDKNSLQLRNQLCNLMNRMHTYRYKISHYIHNDKKTEDERQQVIIAFSEFISQKSDNTDIEPVEQYMDERIKEENANTLDERADERDILGYTTTQKRFYKTIMMSIYDYFENKEVTDYYVLKMHILRILNCDSIDSDVEPKAGGV